MKPYSSLGLVATLVISATASAQEAPVEQAGASPPPESAAETIARPFRPDWMQLPTGEQIAAHYPSGTPKGLQARVVLRCWIVAAPPLRRPSVERARLERCEVVSETPENRGFGNAALALSRMYVMRSTGRDDVPAIGKHVLVPIEWKAPTP